MDLCATAPSVAAYVRIIDGTIYDLRPHQEHRPVQGPNAGDRPGAGLRGGRRRRCRGRHAPAGPGR